MEELKSAYTKLGIVLGYWEWWRISVNDSYVYYGFDEYFNEIC